MATKKKTQPAKPMALVEIVTGASGLCVYLNGLRISGGKPWGNGTVLVRTECDPADIKTAMSPPHYSKTKGWIR